MEIIILASQNLDKDSMSLGQRGQHTASQVSGKANSPLCLFTPMLRIERETAFQELTALAENTYFTGLSAVRSGSSSSSTKIGEP